MYSTFGWMPENAAAKSKAVQDTKTALAILDKHLMCRTYLVGNCISLADIVVGNALVLPFKALFDENFRKEFINVTRWMDTLVHQPEWIKVWGRVTFAKVSLNPAGAAAAGGDKKADKKAAKAEKKAEKKEAPKKEAPKPKKKDEDEEPPMEDWEIEEKKNKKPNPLDSLPPSSMSLDEWKKVYSNTDNLMGEAMPKFWQMYDPQGYSIWQCEYEKAEGEGTVLFMTCNLVSGFLQRLDKLRKYSFATMAVLGEEPNLEIQGCWMFRGQEIPEEMREHPSFDFFKFRRMDVSKEAEKTLIAEFWCNDRDDKIGGMRVRENKAYK